MIFDFKNFLDELYDDYKDKYTLNQIEELLSLDESYLKDTPVSTGKNIKIEYFHFKGQKRTSKSQNYTGDIINYNHEFGNGINIIIADNLKGKSSIFKMIKYILTGSNSIKPNVKKWIDDLLLCFSIGERKYTAYLNLEGRLSASLLFGQYRNINELEQNKDKAIFTAKSETEYQKKIEDFFFQQFSYYSLKWTQKNSAKDSNDLLEVGTSWKTYFKSIFLESKDTSSLIFGSQDRKVFQMLLGLHLTYPINQLCIRRDFILNEKSKKQYLEKKDLQHKDIVKLKNQLETVEQRLSRIESDDVTLKPLLDKSESIIVQIKNENNMTAKNEQLYNDKYLVLKNTNNDLKSLEQKISRLNGVINKNIKKINDLSEYIEIGVFFSNLDITQCPSCNHKISKDKANENIQNHKCSLCNEEIIPDSDIRIDNIQEKIEDLKDLNSNITKELKSLEIEYVDYKNKEREIRTKLDSINALRQNSTVLEKLNEELSKTKKEIESLRPTRDERDKLLAEKAVIQFQIEENQKITEKIDIDFESQIKMIEDAINRLNIVRFKESKDILDNLKSIMLSEIHELGLTSISEISISDKFDVLYNQDGDFISFNDIAEGEQLRAKLAFYLSLIQLDIERNFGRHTRFLIIDSPGKEEADEKYLSGLSRVLKSIQSRFGDNLQILIGTAERKLSNIVDNELNTPEDEFIF